MKIKDLNIDDLVIDDWGNILKVVKLLKTRVKLTLESKSDSKIYTYEGINVGDEVTYDSAHLMFLKIFKKDGE